MSTYAPIPAGIGDSIGDIWDSITGPASSIAEGISFASDPLGWSFGKVQDALDGLVSRLLPWLMSATKPDLTAEWFIRMYKVSFGIAILVWVFIVLFRLVAVARGRVSGAEVIELFTTRTMTFIGGAMWGPAAGWAIVETFHSLSEGLLRLFGSTTESALTSLLSMIRSDWKGVPGGLLFATGLLICMLVALTLVVVMLVVAMVALYLSGVIFPLGWVWITDDPARRPIALRLAWTWLGLNAAHPLMFLLLAASFAFIASMVPMSADPGIALLTNGVAAFIVMVITAFSPVLLFKFAPVMPTSAGQTVPGFNPSGGDGGGGGADSNDLRRVVDEQSGEDAVAPDGGGSGASGAGSAGGAPGDGAAPGPLETEAMNAFAGDSGGADAAGANPVGEADNVATSAGGVDELGPEASGGEPPTEQPTVGSSSTAEAAQGASSGAEAGEAAEVAAGAGAAESATGVGAVVGIPTLIAAAGMEAASKAVEAGGQGADMAASDMDDYQGGNR